MNCREMSGNQNYENIDFSLMVSNFETIFRRSPLRKSLEMPKNVGNVSALLVGDLSGCVCHLCRHLTNFCMPKVCRSRRVYGGSIVYKFFVYFFTANSFFMVVDMLIF